MKVAGPTITSTTVGPGHDGRAEVVVELLYPNGGRTQLSLAQEVVSAVLDAAGMNRLEELHGHQWTMLTTGLPTAGRPTQFPEDTSTAPTLEEPCST